MKKKLALFVASILIAGSFAGCTPASTTDTTKTDTAVKQETSQTTEAQTTTQTTEPADNKLVVALQTNSFVSDYDDNYFTKYLENKLGVDIEFYQLPAAADEVRTKVSLMTASGSNLPDVLIVDNALTPEMILQYGSSGIFLPLNEYVQNAEKMPNYNAIPEEDRKVMDDTQTMANGMMYSLSKYEPETWNLTPNRTFINKVWLDKLGLEMPKTTAELKEVLKAFCEKDPNGNGVKDEIGVYGYQSGGYGQNVIAGLMNAFEFWNNGLMNGGLALSPDGAKVIAPFTTDNFKAGLLYLNDLYKEGLLSPEIFTDEDTQFKATLNNEVNIVGLTSFGSLSNYPDAANNKNFLEMELIAPLTGPNGVCYTPYTEYSPGQELFIFSSSQKVDLALKLADEFYNPEISLIARFGEEGVDWTREEAQLASMNNAYVAEKLYDKVTLAYISNYWMETTNKSWHNVNPRYASLAMMNTVANGTKPYNPEDKTQLVAKSYNYYFDKHPERVLPLLHYTEEETGRIQEAISNIPSYIHQSMAEFITGARDVEGGWDKYLQELESMGLGAWLEVAQSAYDRTQK